jgi:lipopolysaccharide/colanic/teichoic acid biosynthesis glycosyltransferase
MSTLGQVEEAGPFKAGLGSRVEVWKRVLDIGCIVLALPILVPLGLLMGLAIKMLSPGPILFRQVRVGYLGQHFRIVKFRTMKVNADDARHREHLKHLIKTKVPLEKMDARGDERLIRFGRFMRATGLDEVPQVLNVLRGEMSLVGPRPCVPYEYEALSSWQKQRFETLPGLTGLWQVSGKNKTTFDEMVAMDIWYARNKSLGLDLLIFLKTVPAVLAEIKEMVRKARQQHSTPGNPPRAGAEN